METSVLRRLRDLTDFEVADGNPDVRGWTVRGGDGKPLGAVHELIVALDALKVRYLDIELDAGFNINDHERHILLPIGAAVIDGEGDNVFVTALNEAAVLRYPPYVELEITRDYEEAMLRALGVAPAANEAGFYERDTYNAGAFYGGRK